MRYHLLCTVHRYVCEHEGVTREEIDSFVVGELHYRHCSVTRTLNCLTERGRIECRDGLYYPLRKCYSSKGVVCS